MTEKLASTESRERFEKVFGEPLFETFKRDSAGIYYSREARRAWEVWQLAERDTRERIAQIATEVRDKFIKVGFRENAYGADEVVKRIRGKGVSR